MIDDKCNRTIFNCNVFCSFIAKYSKYYYGAPEILPTKITWKICNR